MNSNTAAQLVEYIDQSAEQILDEPDRANYQKETRVTADYVIDSMRRGVCFTVAQGNQVSDPWTPFVVQPHPENPRGNRLDRILRTIDADVALPFLHYDSQLTHPESTKPYYQLAYVILVHTNFENVKALIEALAAPSVFIYVHIDLSASPLFKEEMQNLLEERGDFTIMPTSFHVTFAHISLLWIEIRAFFDLLDLIDFDYIINLSGSDYPLKSAETIYRACQRLPGSNWLWWDTKSRQISGRTEYMYYCAKDDSQFCSFSEAINKEFRSWESMSDLFPTRYKSSQWVILHRTAVEYIRSSEAGKLLMMWAESTQCPDEMVLATLLGASPLVNQTYRDPKRLLRWLPWGWHPYEWQKEDRGVIETWQDHFLWIRKVDVTKEPELKEILDDIRRRDELSNLAVVSFMDGIAPDIN